MGRMALYRMMLAAACMGMLALGCGEGDTNDNKSNTGKGDGGAKDGGNGDDTTPVVPKDTSVEGFAAFLESEYYREQPAWRAETAEPRDVDSAHGVGQVRLWMNEIAIAGQEEDGENLPVDSMAVKELYAEGKRVGVAAMLKTEEGSGPGSWLFFCYGPATRCSHSQPEHPADDPLYAKGLDEDCGFCHSTVITGFPR